jgi:Protein of unknown function (DUF2384)
MSKSITSRHTSAAAPVLSAGSSIPRAKRTAQIGPKSSSKSLHVKVRDTVAVRSRSKKTSGQPVLEVDLNRMVAGEVARQLRQSGITPSVTNGEDAYVREAREYAHKAFGDAAKANRWLVRPSVRLGGVSPIDYLETHDDAGAVYAALDAIAYGFPL